MPTTTISPHARIAALIGVLLIAIAGSAVFVLHGHSQAAPVTTPPLRSSSEAHPAKPVHVVAADGRPAPPARRSARPSSTTALVVAGFYNPQLAGRLADDDRGARGSRSRACRLRSGQPPQRLGRRPADGAPAGRTSSSRTPGSRSTSGRGRSSTARTATSTRPRSRRRSRTPGERARGGRARAVRPPRRARRAARSPACA